MIEVRDREDDAAAVVVRDPKGNPAVVGRVPELGTPGFFGAFDFLESSAEAGSSAVEPGFLEVQKTLNRRGKFTVPIGFAQTPGWNFWLVQWFDGGCGLASQLNPSILLAVHRECDAWAVFADRGHGFRALPRIEETQPGFEFTTSRLTPNNCWVIESFRFACRNGAVSVQKEPKTYRWFGSELVADTPVHARHWAHQEVAWHVVSASAKGGVAVAYAPCPRRKDRFDGVMPEPGDRSFLWRSRMVAVGKNGKRWFLGIREALELAKTGRWDVVLEKRQGRSLATWLVEHDKDFLHSTPPSAIRTP